MSAPRVNRPRRAPRRLVAVGVGVLVLPSLACTSGGSASGGTAERSAPAPAVEAVKARHGRLPLAERVSGLVRAENQVEIRPEIAGRVAAVLVRSGDAVERGQTLVRLDESTLREQLRQAEASVRLEEASAKGARARVAELEAQVSRARELAAEELISRLQLETLEAQLAAAQASADEADARVEQARATLEERRSAVEKTVIRAPVAGRVGRRHVEVGMQVDTGTLLFEIGSLDELIVEVPLTGEMLGHVREGQPVVIQAADPGVSPLRATLSRIPPFLARGSFSTIGEIDVRNPGHLRPGMFVTVDLLYGESEEATLVPTSALWEEPRSGVRGVFVAALPPTETEPDGRGTLSPETHDVRFRAVEVVGEGRGTAGVAGVEPGEWVVTVGQHLLRSDETTPARVRSTRWERVLELQSLQHEDLLRGFLEKQQRLARTLGAKPPSTAEFGGTASPAPAAGGGKGD